MSTFGDTVKQVADTIRDKSLRLKEQEKTENLASVLCCCAVSQVMSSNVHVAVDDLKKWKSMTEQQIQSSEIFSAALERANALISHVPPDAHDGVEIAALRHVVDFYNIMLQLDNMWNSQVQRELRGIKYDENTSKWPKVLLLAVKRIAVSKNATQEKTQVTRLIQIFNLDANLDESVLRLFHAERSAFLDFMDKWKAACKKRGQGETRALKEDIAKLQATVEELTKEHDDAAAALDDDIDLRESSGDRVNDLEDSLRQNRTMLDQKTKKLASLELLSCPCLAKRNRKIVSRYALCEWCEDYFAPFDFEVDSFEPCPGVARKTFNEIVRCAKRETK